MPAPAVPQCLWERARVEAFKGPRERGATWALPERASLASTGSQACQESRVPRVLKAARVSLDLQEWE